MTILAIDRAFALMRRTAIVATILAVTTAARSDETITGNLTVTGTADVGGAVKFGTQGGAAGVSLTYANADADTLTFFANRNPASFLWAHTSAIAAMRLTAGHELVLYKADGATAGLTFTPATSAIALGTTTLYRDSTTGALRTNGALTVDGAATIGGAFTATSLSASNGTLAGGAVGLTLSAGGTDQNITLAPSGAGAVLLGHKVGIGTSNLEGKLTVGGSVFIRSGGTLYLRPTDNSYDFNLQAVGSGAGTRLAIGSNAFTNEALSILANGNVGVGTSSPTARLDVNGDARVGGAFTVGTLYYSALQIVSLPVGTERWVKLATIPNNHSVTFQLRSGSTNSEEIANVRVFGSYHILQTGITVERQTYFEHLREVRVTGVDGGPKAVFIRIRADSYAPSVQWRAVESRGALVAIHNLEETPSGGLSHLISGNLVTSTNSSLAVGGSIGVGTSSPAAGLKLDVIGDTRVVGKIAVTTGGRFDGPVRIAPQGDLPMGAFTQEP